MQQYKSTIGWRAVQLCPPITYQYERLGNGWYRECRLAQRTGIVEHWIMGAVYVQRQYNHINWTGPDKRPIKKKGKKEGKDSILISRCFMVASWPTWLRASPNQSRESRNNSWCWCKNQGQFNWQSSLIPGCYSRAHRVIYSGNVQLYTVKYANTIAIRNDVRFLALLQPHPSIQPFTANWGQL